MAKAGTEAQETFRSIRKFRITSPGRLSEECYLLNLRSAVYRDLAQYENCELLWRRDLIADANAGEMNALIDGVREYFASNYFKNRIEAKQRELKSLENQKADVEKEVAQLKLKKETLKSRVEHLESKYAIYKKADEITEAAQQEAKRITDEAASSAESIRKEADTEKYRTLSDARNEAAGIIASADKTAQDIREEAEKECERLRDEKINNIDTLFPEFREKIESNYEEGFEENRKDRVKTAEEITELRSKLEDAADSERENFRNQQTDTSRQVSNELMSYKDTLLQELDALRKDHEDALERQANMFTEQIETLSKGIEQRRIASQNDISAKLQEWKTDFYKTQYKELASVYCLFEESLKGAEKRENEMMADTYAQNENDAQKPNEEDPYRAELHRRICNMRKLVGQLKNALSRIGIVEYAPNPGDKYDYDYHRCEDAEDGDRISEVKQNGMILKRENEADIVLKQAVVEVDNEYD